MEKKGNKNMKKKHLIRIISMFVMIVLLPLLLALMHVGYKLIIMPSLHPISMEMQRVFTVIIFGIPISLIIAYGYITREKITSILSGVFLIPLLSIYCNILFELFDPHFVISGLGWGVIPNFFAPFMLICGLAGYFASRGTKVSLLIAIFLGIVFIFIMLGGGH